MKSFTLASSICAVSILGACLFGCNRTPVVPQHPDEVDAVNHALAFNNLSNIQVQQDRTQGVMTLTGTVATPDQKTQAATIASTNAGDYTITNKISVTAPASQAKADSDSGIKDKYEAMLKEHKELDRQNIDCKVDRGTIVLTGEVRNDPQRREAVRLAHSLPNVQHVVDQIKVQSKS